MQIIIKINAVKSSLTLNSTLTLIANISFALSSWLLLILITKFFSAELLGHFVLVLSIVTPVYLFFSLKLRTLIVIDLDERYSIEQYIHARLLSNSLAFLLSFSIVALFFPNIPTWLIIIVASYKWCDSWSELSYSYFQRSGLFAQVTRSQCARAITSILTMLGSAMLTQSPVITFSTWLIVSACFAVWDLARLSAHHRENHHNSINWQRLIFNRQLIKSSIAIYRKHVTLSISLAVGALFVYIPNFFIQHFDSVETAGQFATISYFLVAGGLVINSLSQAASPRLAQLVSQHSTDEYFKLSMTLCGLGALIGIIGVAVATFFGQYFLTLFYNQAIAQLDNELVLICAAAGVRYVYIFLTTAMNALRHFEIQTKIYSLGTSILFILCWFLVPNYGTLGAASAMLLATICELFLFATAFFVNVYKNKELSPQ